MGLDAEDLRGPARRRLADGGDVTAFCDSKLTPYKIPKLLELVDALPRNANGKVLKRDLRDRNG